MLGPPSPEGMRSFTGRYPLPPPPPLAATPADVPHRPATESGAKEAEEAAMAATAGYRLCRPASRDGG